MSPTAEAGSGEPSIKKTCFVCDTELPDTATRCIRCGWPLATRRSYWMYRSLTLVLIPAVLWMASVFWERAQEKRVGLEELERSQTQLLEVLTERMERLVALRLELWRATATFVRRCPAAARDTGDRLTPIVACAGHYAEVIHSLDQAIVDLTWRVDSLSLVSPNTYRVIRALTSTYWSGCTDEKPVIDCGYRQRAVRLVHGIGLGSSDAASLKSCLADRDADPGCQSSSALARTMVQEPIDQDANAFFCLVVNDIKDARVNVFKRRSTMAGGDPALEQLVDRLERNMDASACTAIVEEWDRRHPLTPKQSARSRLIDM